MNCLKNLFNLFFLLIVSTSLTGCFITGATPGTNKVIYMKTGDTRYFQVKGPAINEIFKYSWRIIRYSTGGDGSVERLDINSKAYEFTANPDGEGTNLIKITCYLMRSVGGHWSPDDSRTWEIRVTPATPSSIWQGHYIIKNQEDLARLNGITEVTGNLVISEDSHSQLAILPPYNHINNLEDLSSLRSIGGNLEISFTFQFLKNLQGLDNLESIEGGLILFVTYLESLDALINITSLVGGLSIESNFFDNLDGLSNLCSVNSIRIFNNHKLCTNLAEELKEQILSCDPDGVSGNIFISENKECP